LINSLKLTGTVTQSPAVSATGAVAVRVGKIGLATMDLLPNHWDGRPDVQKTNNKNYYKLVNPVSVDVGANILHNTSYGAIKNIRGAGVTIAVVDTGIYFDSDTINTLTGRINQQFLGQADYIDPTCVGKGDGTLAGIQNAGYCWITDKHYSRDGNGHGTMVAGAIWNNLMDEATGATMGVAPDANVISVRVMDNNGVGTYETVIKGIQWVVENKAVMGIRIMNLSISAQATVPYFVDPMNRAVERAWQSGIVVVAAAGNLGPAAETITVPGNDPYVITVGAINEKRTPGYWADDILPAFSSTGPTGDGFVKPDILAPGTQIVSFMYNACKATVLDPDCEAKSQKLVRDHADYSETSNLFRMSGTSTATPIVSSVVALMLQVNPDLTPDQVKYRLIHSARFALDNQGEPAYNILQQGSGRIWAPDAVLGTFPVDGLANQGMNIVSDLAHNNYGDPADNTFHYQGFVIKALSEDGRGYLYSLLNPNGTIIALGASDATNLSWLDYLALSNLGLSWNGATLWDG
jgi:serine protease AprX